MTAKINNAQLCTYNGSLLTVKIPAYALTAFQTVFDKSIKLHNGYVKLDMATPRKPRTTGKGSQNNNVRGIARQIHNHCGQGIDSIIEYAACRAADEGIIPFRENENGVVVYNSWGCVMGTSESTWSTIEASGVIKILIAMADDMGIKLKGNSKDCCTGEIA